MTTRNHSHTRELIRSFNKTATFLTAFPTKTQMDQLILVDDFTPTRTPVRNPRAGIAGREFTERGDDMTWTSGMSISENLTKSAAGTVLPFAMGGITTAGAGPYTHVLRATAVGTIDMPTTSMLVRGTSTRGHDGSNVEYQDLGCNEFTISGSGSAGSPIKLNSTWIGSGKVTQDVTRADITSVNKESLMRMGGLAFTLGNAGGAESSIVNKINSFSFGWNNGITEDRNRPAGSGMYAAYMLRGDMRACTFSFQIAHDGSDDFLDYLMPDATPDGSADEQFRLACTLTMTDDSGNGNFVKIEIPEFYVVSLNPTMANDLIAYDVVCQPVWDVDGSGYDATDLGPAKITISNAAEYSTVPLTAAS